MRLTMRLYRLHDLDLMYIYKMPNISIQSIVKVMLKNYIKDRNSDRHIATRLTIPDVKHNITLPKTAQFHISLNEGEDDDVISWIEQIPKGFRNSMLKNMLRTYLSFPIVIPYETEITEVVKPTNKNDISIAKYNEVMEKNVRIGKKTYKPRKVKEAINTAETVLNSSPISKNEIKNETTKKDEEIRIPVKTTPPVSKNEIAESKNETNKESILNEPDLFDDFESMMDNF